MHAYSAGWNRKNPWRRIALLILAISLEPGSVTRSGRVFGPGAPLFESYSESSSRPHHSDEAQPLEARARDYLDVKCAACHQPGGIGKGGMDLRYSTSLERTGLFSPGRRPGPDGKPRFHIRPGDFQASDIYIRMASLGKDAMPPLGNTQVDKTGLALMRKWIESLAADSLSPGRALRKKGPLIIHDRERLELTPGPSNPKAGEVTAVKIINQRGGREAGISISTRIFPGGEDWILRLSRPLSRGRYWLVIQVGEAVIRRDLLVI